MKGKAVGNVITQYPHMAEGRRANFLTANRPMIPSPRIGTSFLEAMVTARTPSPGGSHKST